MGEKTIHADEEGKKILEKELEKQLEKELKKELKKEIKKCTSPKWCDDSNQFCHIDETGEGKCVDDTLDSDSSLKEITIGGKKIIGSDASIKALKKKLDLESSLHTPEPLNKDPGSPEGSPPKTPPLPKLSISKEQKLLEEAMQESVQKAKEEKEKSKLHEKKEKGKKEKAKLEEATPVLETKDVDPKDPKDVKVLLEEMIPEPHTDIKKITKWRKEISHCLGLQN